LDIIPVAILWPIPFEINQYRHAAHNSKGNQNVEERFVITPQPADDGRSIQLAKVRNKEEADGAAD